MIRNLTCALLGVTYLGVIVLCWHRTIQQDAIDADVRVGAVDEMSRNPSLRLVIALQMISQVVGALLSVLYITRCL